MEFYEAQQLIDHSTFLGYAAALSDGEASYLLWIVGAITLVAWAVGLRAGAWSKKWYRIFHGMALLALPALLLVGTIVSMMSPA